MITIARLPTYLVVALTLSGSAGLVACGGKDKKQETLPGDGSGGGDGADTRSTEATTPVSPTDKDASLQDVIYFGFDQADLDPEAKKKLDENAAWLKEDVSRSLTIEGHTDEAGTPEYNLGLGERRARAARDYLIALGADATKVSIITFGEEKPSGGGDAQNRRSVFIATKK